MQLLIAETVVCHLKIKNVKIFVSILILLLSYSCADKKTSELDFLIGTWKRDNKEQFEVWEKNNSSNLTGYSYRIKDNQKAITETLVIKKIGDQFVYEATVPDQNDGRTVQFILNTGTDSLFSFENDNHDFPKKIQYKRINDNQLKVIVLGDDDTGFSYIQIKQ
ncbi:DUF6265 family protein [uncultured Eudoraea sp.]|uniref:DUF6265 family protein n=1 Tax=uncultured Eudoraea sp. TaxID=1035614 RepID=UPI00260392B4|nr:DUF6265 family protein [uncultured Eudoraea sp.]